MIPSEEQPARVLDVLEMKPERSDWDSLDMSRRGTVKISVRGGQEWNWQAGGLQQGGDLWMCVGGGFEDAEAMEADD